MLEPFNRGLVTDFPVSGSDPNPGLVAVDVAVRYLERTYLAHTSFVSAPVVTDTPRPTNTPTRTPVPPTSTPTPTPTNTTTPTLVPTDTPTVTPTPTP